MSADGIPKLMKGGRAWNWKGWQWQKTIIVLFTPAPAGCLQNPQRVFTSQTGTSRPSLEARYSTLPSMLYRTENTLP
ncbi:hypothetical protein LX36DRAFT_76070 [Colletotrichum falcatum]|nr:hypothetical protein LX36DRAFT_76070 [Colletotrichum falcatum]